MINIAICDDDLLFLESARRIISEIESEELLKINTFSDSKKFIDILNKEFFNIIFLDIEMPKFNGFEIAEKLNAISQNSILIFVTSYEQNAIKCYNYEAFRFIRKKDFKNEIKQVFFDSINKIHRQKAIITLKYKSIIYKLTINDINYIISYNNYINVNFKNEILKFRTPLFKFQDELLTSTFAFVNRGILVNCNHVERFDLKNKILYLDNGDHINASKKGLENVKKKLTEYE